MPVHGVADAEHAAARVLERIHVVDGPDRGRLDPDRNRMVADQVVGDLGRHRVGDLRRRLVDVVAPDDQPFMPGPHHPHQTHADAADVGAGLHDPIEHARTMRDVFGKIGLEDDVHRARDAHLAFHRQADVLRDLRASAVGADHVFGADLVVDAGDIVLDVDGDAVLVLRQSDIFPVEHDGRAARGGRAHEDRLQQVLRHVADRRRARERVVGLAQRMGAPGQQAPELLASQRSAEHVVAHVVLGSALGLDLVLDAEVANDLHRALVGDVRARRAAGPVPLGDDQRLDSVGREQRRRRGAGRAGSDNEDVGFDHGFPPAFS